MPSIRLTRPRKPSSFRFRTWTLPEKWAGSGLLFLGWFAALGLLALLPPQWLKGITAKDEEAWFALALPQGERITQAFCAGVDPGPIARGDEPGALRVLAENPLNHAVADPGKGRIWVRSGDRLKPLPLGDEERELLRWAVMAKAGGKLTWSPDAAISRSRPGSLTLVPKASGMVVIKLWIPDSLDVDTFLERVMVGWMPIRFGLVRSEHLRNRQAQARMPDGRGWAPQVANLAGPAPFREAVAQKRAFGERFHPVVRMPDRVFRDQLRVRRLRATIAWGTYAFGAILSGSMLLLQVRSQSRRQMDSKRLAALAHSLKTPLAMMKMRCDSALNANLSRERQVAHLLRVGDGVEKLLHIIEHGLEPFRVAPGVRSEATWPAAFFQDLEAEFRPPFEELGRILEVSADGYPIRTSPSSLRSALSILVENALLHGKGTVRLTLEAGSRETVLRVHDEGMGIPRDRLSLLRQPGGESPDAVPTILGTSQGLGLQLLLSLAHREGWGLEIEHGVEGGFGVSIRIPR